MDKINKAFNLLLGNTEESTPQKTQQDQAENTGFFVEFSKNDVPTLKTIKEQIKGVEFEEAYSLFVSIRNVPQEQALLFMNTYNPTRRLSAKDSFRLMYDEVNGDGTEDFFDNAPDNIVNLLKEQQNLEERRKSTDHYVQKAAIEARLTEIRAGLNKYKQQKIQEQAAIEAEKQELRKKEGRVWQSVNNNDKMKYIAVINGVVNFYSVNLRTWTIAPDFMQNNGVFQSYVLTTLKVDEIIAEKQEKSPKNDESGIVHTIKIGKNDVEVQILSNEKGKMKLKTPNGKIVIRDESKVKRKK